MKGMISLAPIKVPIIDWLSEYNWRQTFPSDLNAGITVFMLLIPQGMAYAVLAGMPPVYGLYTAIVPPLVYALLGTSRQLSLGPFAITSLLLGNTCTRYGYDEGGSDYIKLVATMSMVSGFITLGLGLLKLGALANFLSQSVLTGFITASACVITLSQFKYILGLHVPRFPYTHQTIYYILSHLKDTDVNALWIGLVSILFLYSAKRYKARNKADPSDSKIKKALRSCANVSSLLCIIIGIVAAYLVHHNVDAKLPIVGHVPAGLRVPGFEFKFDSFAGFINMLPDCFILSIIGFTGNWAVVTRYAKINHYQVSATQELIATGYATILGVVCNSFFASGGLARSAVNAESGAKTQLSGVISAILITISLLSLTTLFYYIPMAVLGAIIIVSVLSMMDFDQIYKSYKVGQKRDCAIMCVTFMCTFFLGISQGIGLGILLSIGTVLMTVSFPQISTLGRMPVIQQQQNDPIAQPIRYQFKSITRYPEAEQLPGVAIIRMDASLFFANAASFKKYVMDSAQGTFVAMSPSSSANSALSQRFSEKIWLIIIDCSAWVDIDLVGLDALIELKSELQIKYKIQLEFVHAIGSLRDTFHKIGIAKYDENRLGYDYVEDIIAAASLKRSSTKQQMRNLNTEVPTEDQKYILKLSESTDEKLPTGDNTVIEQAYYLPDSSNKSAKLYSPLHSQV